ncbi:MAG: sodium/glutamate symporter [Pseudomonadota bacterium]
MIVDISAFASATIGLAVFLLGVELNDRVAALRQFNIPEAVSGGLAVACGVLLIYLLTDIEIAFDLASRDFLLVLFFAGIGLNARMSDLIAGGKILAILLGLTLVTIVVQNVIGALSALFFGFPAQAGVLFGSAALIGGHGTAIAWAPEVTRATGLDSATELGVAVATLGLVVAALIGGPVAGHLVKRHNLRPDDQDTAITIGVQDDAPEETTRIDHKSVMRALLYLNLAIIAGYSLDAVLESVGLMLPLFVPCLIMGIVIANLRSWLAPRAHPVSRTAALALISEFALGAFLAMSLMSLQLWTIAALGPAIAVGLVLQTLFTLVFVIYVLFPAMGRNYDAAVLAAGFGGFALGATPTAIANMTAVTKRYGPSPIAFIVLPLVSAFFVDIANAIVIQTVLNF